ncbi:MAG: S4 domain-containing protein [Rhodocyclaceae bacterium]|jgi:ribosome-associated heat shock protein Hsp15|nr:S4 domain-containing protein [Rhodocyclaceae bacterium]
MTKDSNEDPSAIRLDKWLWAARIYKTRRLATEAIDAGHVRMDGHKPKPARAVRIGARLEITRESGALELIVQGLSELRGPAPIAQRLYTETEASVKRRETALAERQLQRHDLSGERPTKRERRQLDRFRDGF